MTRVKITAILDRAGIFEPHVRGPVAEKLRKRRIRRGTINFRMREGLPPRPIIERPDKEPFFTRPHYEKQTGKKIRTLDDIKMRYVMKILEMTNNNITHAADLLGIATNTVSDYRKKLEPLRCAECKHFPVYCKCEKAL